MRKNQGGFTLIETLLVLVVIGLIGGIGWLVYQRNKSQPETVHHPKITNFEECVAAGNPVMESHPEQCSYDGQTFENRAQRSITAEDNYLEVKELGVKFKINKALDGLKYEIPEEFNGDGPVVLHFSSEEFNGKPCAADSGIPASYLMQKRKDQMEANEFSAVSKSAKKIGDNYYYFTNGHAACSPYDQSIQSRADLLQLELNKALETMELL